MTTEDDDIPAMLVTHDPIITLRNVTRTYRLEGEEVYALRGVNLEIYRGEYLSIMGPSGSGKSTLFNMIGGLDRPTSGEIFLDGADIASLSERKLAWLRSHEIGYIFQTFNLIPTWSAVENVALPMVFGGMQPKEANERAARTLDRVGLAHRMSHRPSELSGGQQQRVACARALANDPAILLADEPTGNLDLKTGAEVLALLKELQAEKGTTIVCATHDMKMLAASDRVVWIRDGQVDQIKSRAQLSIEIGSLDGEEIV